MAQQPANANNYHLEFSLKNTTSLDIPIKDTKGSKVTTTALTGCSFITTKLDDKHYRCWHDARTPVDQFLNNGYYYPQGTGKQNVKYEIISDI